jgi:hypothetical protein
MAAPGSVLLALGELRRELQVELRGLQQRQSALDCQLRVVSNDIEFRRRRLDIVVATETQLAFQRLATERQLAHQRLAQPNLERGGPGPSTQVSGSSHKWLKTLASLCGPLGLVSVL